MPYVTDGNCSLSNRVHPDEQTFSKQRAQQAEEVSAERARLSASKGTTVDVSG